MRFSKTVLVAASMGVAAVAVSAQQPAAPQFAPPVRLTDDKGFVGDERLYPSPVVHDLDGDGTPELVIGDLRGFLTVTRRSEVGASPAWDTTEPLPGADGQPLKFHNW